MTCFGTHTHTQKGVDQREEESSILSADKPQVQKRYLGDRATLQSEERPRRYLIHRALIEPE